MDSHSYQFEPKELAPALIAPLLPVLLFSLLYHGTVLLKLMPPPRPTFDTDQTILVHQAEASDQPSGAAVLLVGDSSCLMNVEALPLGVELGQPVLNLGTLSLLGLAEFGTLVEHYLRANPGQVKVVILILHPEALRRGTPDARYVRFLRSFFERVDDCSATDLAGTIICQGGFENFRSRVVGRLIPTPLSGAYGVVYGFSDDLERYMSAHGGSVIEPNQSKFSGNAEYWLGERLEQPSAAFRRVVIPPVKLVVAATPIPRSFALPEHPQRYREILSQWGQWSSADAVLTNLPPTMDDVDFASVTHLTATGRRTYTALLAEELKRALTSTK